MTKDMKDPKHVAGPESAGQTNEATAMVDIVGWSKTCPEWQRDALRRLYRQDQLDGSDISELTTLCKDGARAVPLSLHDVKDAEAALLSVTLKSLHSVRQVNLLASDQKVTFQATGITIFYGDNGSGKSGYARILKSACRARSPRGETVLPSIFSKVTDQPSAEIQFLVNGKPRSSTWKLNQGADAALSAVSVFDSQTANVHVDQTNSAAYTPQPLRILASLAQACQQVRLNLEAELTAIEQQTPAVISHPPCRPGTKTSKLLANLTSATIAEVTALVSMTPAESARLATLRTDLAADPTNVSKQLRGQKSRLDKAILRVTQLATAASDNSLQRLQSTFSALVDARAAAQVASTSLFAQEALPDIGSATWRALWDAARNFSTAGAYPDKQFPVTEDGARCVLCLQELNPAAALRFNSFAAFVEDACKRREEKAQKLFDDAIAEINAAFISDAERDDLLAVLEHESTDIAFAKDVSTAIQDANARLAYIREMHQTKSSSTPPLPVLPLEKLQSISDELLQRATALLADADSDVRKTLVSEFDELDARAWLAGIKDDVIAEIGRRQEIVALQNALKQTATNKVTAKSAALAASLVTGALRSQFTDEVKALGLREVEVEMRQDKTAQGVPMFRVSLTKNPAAKVGSVLSEGEHRCVALAAFLAELSTTASRSCLVFDDPMSSLDHMRRNAVAKRLAKEGANRQIVIFTHDISFLLMMKEACIDARTTFADRCISRGTDFAGFCSAKSPTKIQSIEESIESLSRHLENVKKLYESGRQAEWSIEACSLYTQLRTNWELAVEDFVAPVLRRLSNKVDTKGIYKLTVISEEHCKVMRDAYGRCSSRMHSNPKDQNNPLPRPDEVATDIQDLRTWVADIKGLQRNVDQAKSLTANQFSAHS
jgi:energy-coupling factor transporter ATP-binding protein EcfA2